MSQPDVPVPGLRPNRFWYRMPSLLISRYEYYDTTPTREEFNRMSKLFDMYCYEPGRWNVVAQFGLQQWRVQIDSTDPPFQLAEALYDAAK